MALFKDEFSLTSIARLRDNLSRVAPARSNFDAERFYALATDNLDALEMRQRSNQIVDALLATLPSNFIEASELLVASLAPVEPKSNIDNDLSGWTNQFATEHGINGWLIMPLADFIGRFGHNDLDTALYALREMTQRFSAEFGVRYLLRDQPQETLAIMSQWLNHPSQHVRRWLSEGTRPLLPWGIKLHEFVNEPNITYLWLDTLKDDPSDYVRLSVANHLNDHAKHHPQWVNEIAAKWQAPNYTNRTKLIKHGCRTLIKQGNPDTLALFGFRPVDIASTLTLSTHEITLGESLSLELMLTNPLATPQNLLIDYVVYYQKANGSLSPKVFKWKTLVLSANQTITLKKTHSLKPVTTRKYYAGEHQIAVLINGVEQLIQSLKLTV